ncbi:MAG: hypothetical protein J6K95_02430 [Rikenellaceae bacterium]|nr:hypothetical protein [Rikenellaceae bacterium]
MVKEVKQKKHLVVSYQNLAEELKDELKAKYPLGFTDSMIRIDKPSGDFFYAVVLETEEISYLVKIDVKIDDSVEEEEDKDYYDDDIKGAEEIADSSEDEDEDDM